MSSLPTEQCNYRTAPRPPIYQRLARDRYESGQRLTFGSGRLGQSTRLAMRRDSVSNQHRPVLTGAA